MHRFRQQLANVPLDQLGNFRRVLVGDQARRKFYAGCRGDYSFCALAGVSAPYAVQLERWTHPELLDDRKSFFTAESGSAYRLAEFPFFPGQRVQRLALLFRKDGDVIVKIRDRDAKIL